MDKSKSMSTQPTGVIGPTNSDTHNIYPRIKLSEEIFISDQLEVA